MNKDSVSISVVRRLPRYYRFLSELSRADIDRISSGSLARMMGVTASQIRQDLNCFGGFGQQGYGYNVKFLRKEIAKILGLDTLVPAVLIGAGNLGKAVLSYTNFEAQGFVMLGVFDNDPRIIGHKIKTYTVMDIAQVEDFCKKNSPAIAALCVPKASAEQLAPLLVANNIKGFWNFSHYDLAMNYPNAAIENVHLSDSLMTLRYMMKDK